MRLDLNFFSTPGSFPEGLKEMFSFYRSGADGWIDGCRVRASVFALHSPHTRGGWRDQETQGGRESARMKKSALLKPDEIQTAG